MAFGSNSRTRIDALLGTIKQRWKLTERGELTSTDWAVTFLEAALVQIIAPSDGGLLPIEAEQCSYKAIRNVLKSGNATVAALEGELSRLAAETRATPLREFWLITRNHFSIPQGKRLTQTIDGTTLTIAPEPPEGFDLSPFLVGGYDDVDLTLPLTGCYSSVLFRARTFDAALGVGSDALSTHYGILNFWLMFGMLAHRVQKAQPIAAAFPGKEAAIFDTNKDRQDGVIYWTSTPTRVNHISQQQWPRLEYASKFATEISGKEKRLREYYCAFARLYFGALVEPDDDNRLVKFWKLAEFLTFCVDQEQRGVAARLATLLPDPHISRAVAEAIQHRRNGIIHGHSGVGRSDEALELFRDLLGQFLLLSLNEGIDDLRVWRKVVELSVTPNGTDNLQEALAFLQKRSQRGRRASVESVAEVAPNQTPEIETAPESPI